MFAPSIKKAILTRYYSIDRKPPKPEPQLMDILPEEEYKALYKVVGEIEMQPEGTRYHKTIAAFKSMVDTWKKDYGKLDHYAKIGIGSQYGLAKISFDFLFRQR